MFVTKLGQGRNQFAWSAPRFLRRPAEPDYGGQVRGRFGRKRETGGHRAQHGQGHCVAMLPCSPRPRLRGALQEVPSVSFLDADAGTR